MAASKQMESKRPEELSMMELFNPFLIPRIISFLFIFISLKWQQCLDLDKQVYQQKTNRLVFMLIGWHSAMRKKYTTVSDNQLKIFGFLYCTIWNVKVHDTRLVFLSLFNYTVDFEFIYKCTSLVTFSTPTKTLLLVETEMLFYEEIIFKKRTKL